MIQAALTEGGVFNASDLIIYQAAGLVKGGRKSPRPGGRILWSGVGPGAAWRLAGPAGERNKKHKFGKLGGMVILSLYFWLEMLIIYG